MDQHLARLLDECGVVSISAASGSGKTVQAQLYAHLTGLPLAWITLDASHASAHRLLSGLTAALSPLRDADVVEPQEAGLPFDMTAQEVAGLTAHGLRPEPAVLVIDDCEHLQGAHEAQACLETFLEYAPPELRVLLLSRVDLAGRLQTRMSDGRIRSLGDEALRLTSQECHELATLFDGSCPAREVHELTGGWVGGAAFVLRYGHEGAQVVRDLPSGRMNELLNGLAATEQQFLLDASVLDVVTRDDALALGGPEGGALWDAVRTRHLPATLRTDDTLVFHPLFRSFLHRHLVARDPGRRARLVRRYARYLCERGEYEEATARLLSVEAVAEARDSLESAARGMCDRSEWDSFLGWAARLGDDRSTAHPALTAARIRALVGQGRLKDAVGLVRDLDRLGLLRAATETDPALVSAAAWALQSAPAEAGRLLRRYTGDYRADVVGYMMEVHTDLEPTPAPLQAGSSDVGRIVTWGLFLQGRVDELAKLCPNDPHAAVLDPNVILADIVCGRSASARQLWERVPPETRDRPQSLFIHSLLLLAEGEPELALSALELAVEGDRRTRFLAPAYKAVSAYVLVQLGRVADAVRILHEVSHASVVAGHTATLEWTQAYLGFALLLEGDVSAARAVLTECVRGMQGSDRRLMLPFAATVLSEAEAMHGDADAAHAAAELGYRTAAAMGTFATLLPALRAFPDVIAREDQRMPDGSPLRRLIVAPSARPTRHPRSTTGAQLVLQPFGTDRDIWVDGVPQKVGRIKIVELLAFLVRHPAGVDRTRLREALFPEATLRNGGNHLRQISFKFRQITGLSIERRDGDLIGLPTNAVVQATDLQFEDLVRMASWVPAEERVQRLEGALGLVTGGPYLQGSDLAWAEERRDHLDLVQEEARLELVRRLLDLGRWAQARDECESLLALNRYSEPTYRLMVRIERTIGSESSVLATYRRAVIAFEDLGLTPQAARALIDTRPPATTAPGARRPAAGGRAAAGGLRLSQRG